MNMKTLEQKLQKADKKQAGLYLFCNFISLMLITAYSAMMYSPTVLSILPEGGDSRKQLYAIFILALFGCVIFTIYASSLFFRKKAKQLGILMALGASRRRLSPGVFQEVLILSCSSSLLGILTGIPFVLFLWQIFRTFLVNSEEMSFLFDFKFLFIPAGLFLVVTGFSCALASVYLKRTNIMEVIQEEHRNEPVKEIGKWCGPAGILILILGAVIGYYSGNIYMALFQKYPPSWLNITYFPVFVGLYMIMLHTVVHGWSSHKKNPYKNLINRSMMKFQGKQTVNSLIVSTVLIAGGCFAIFYLPILASGTLTEANSRLYDYSFHYRADQSLPDQSDITSLAGKYGISLKDWSQIPYLSLAIDGNCEITGEDNSFYYEYRKFLNEGKFLSESGYNQISGQNIDVPRGSFCPVSNKDETNTYWVTSTDSIFTNPVTLKELPLKFGGYAHFGQLTDQIGYYVLDDTDYTALSKGITPYWSGNLVFFNAKDEDSYAFADDLFHKLIDCFSKDCFVSVFYNRIETLNKENISDDANSSFFLEDMSHLSPDASDFRLYWAYMPKFRILSINDFMETFAVFLMTFLFICIICLTAAAVIGYTRCQTIAINNRYIFDDLRRLGGSPEYLMGELRQQCQNVFRIPLITGMSVMSLLYGVILYANDGKITFTEVQGFTLCIGLVIIIASIFYGIYLHTLHRVSLSLGIKKESR